MTADVVSITVYTGATTAQATCLVLYPKKLPKIIAGATAGATGNDTTHIHIPDGVAINDFYNGCVVYTLTGTGSLQARMISDYVASTKLATVNPAFATAPNNTTTYDIYMTEVAVASIIALLTGAIPNAVAGADNGLAIKGTAMALTSAYDAAKTAAPESGGNLAAVKAKTDNLPAAPAIEGNVQGHVADALAAYDPPTKTELDNGLAPLALEATLTAIKGAGWSTQTLVAISALVDDLEGRLTAARAGYLDELGAANLPTDVDTLLARLTALRAGYLDNLSAGAVALEAHVQTHAAAALTAYDPPTKAEMDAALAALNDITVGELLAGDLSDSLSFPANSLADRLRKLFWILCNRMAIVDATGAFTAYKGDGVTPGATGTIADNGTNTVRSAPTWP